MKLSRRSFLGVSTSLALAPQLAWGRPDEIAWHDVRDWGIEGKGWTETQRYFDRFPPNAEKSVPAPVWDLSRHSAGMLVRFETDAPAVHARWKLLKAALAIPHMPATGVSGLDLYARDEQGRDRWLAVAKPTQQQMELKLVDKVDPLPGGKRRLYTLYLPLYNGTESLEIGVDGKASFEGVAPRKEKPIVFYGTSILHGACASRPGMAFPAILGRRFNRPTINLGFSGNGRMEAEVGALLAELDPWLYAIDCLPNMSAEQVAERAEPLVRQLRKARPQTPILLVEDRTFTSAPFLKGTRDAHAARRAALRAGFDRLTAGGVQGLGYLEGESLLGDDGEGATDGSHPNDLGMVRYADAYEKAIRTLVR
ncbi:MAG TPA: SGNH/GDSL hydrolase family protein [Planctomycetota bacterium]|nr:SGNH/GDSL hydrolase family protein [Planctomycetota bacterium]